MELNPYAPPTAALEGAPARAAAPDVPLFFPVSLTKLVVLYFASFSLYQLLWFYENWKLVRHREEVSPLARTIFSVLFCYSLFERIHDEAKGRGLKLTAGAGVLALCWILLTLAGRLPDPLWLVSFLALLPMLAVQKMVNEINHQAAPTHDPNARFRVGSIVTMVIGFPLGLLIIASLFLPAQ